MGYTKSFDPADVWKYATRTLTQSQFPFWTEVITQQYHSHSVSGDSSYTVSIQPPTDETWLLFIDFFLNGSNEDSYVQYRQYDGTNTYAHNQHYTMGHYGDVKPHLNVIKILTHSLYAQLYYKNTTSSNRTANYGYAGFKLGTKKAEFENLEEIEIRPYERDTKYKIRSEFDGLEDLIKDVYDNTVDDYKQVLYFYKDKTIRKDKKTGHIIEKVSSYIAVSYTHLTLTTN